MSKTMRQYILGLFLLVLFSCWIYSLITTPEPPTDADAHTLPKPKSHPEIPLPTNPHIKPADVKGDLLVSAEVTQFWEREHAPGAKLILKFAAVAPADLDRYNREGSDMGASDGSLLYDCMGAAEDAMDKRLKPSRPIPGCAQKIAAATAAGEILAIPPGSMVQVVERRPGFNWARVSLLRSGLHGPTSAAIRKPYVWLGDAVLRTTEEVRLGEGDK